MGRHERLACSAWSSCQRHALISGVVILLNYGRTGGGDSTSIVCRLRSTVAAMMRGTPVALLSYGAASRLGSVISSRDLNC